MRFSFLPTEVKFYDYLAQATANLLEGARALQQLLSQYQDEERRTALVAHITEIEHQGDFLVHEVTHLLPRTLVTPIDSEDIKRLVSAIDDALDALDDATRHLQVYQVTNILKPARQQGQLIVEATQELDEAVKALPDKKHYPRVQERIVQINTLENNGDLVLHEAMSELVEQRSDWFDFIRWKEIYELLEETLDRIEDASDVVQGVMIGNA